MVISLRLHSVLSRFGGMVLPRLIGMDAWMRTLRLEDERDGLMALPLGVNSYSNKDEMLLFVFELLPFSLSPFPPSVAIADQLITLSHE